MIRALFELLVAIIILVLSGLWFRSSAAPAYEPAIVAIGGVLALLDSLRRLFSIWRSNILLIGPTESEEDSISPESAPEVEETDESNLSSTVFFYRRFGEAFPGVRGAQAFSAREGVRRLRILMREPLAFSNGAKTPIWWWRDGDMHVSDFRILNRKTVLLDSQELKLEKLVAVNVRSYYQCFVYLETKPMRRTGLYDNVSDSIAESIKTFGYAREEYALLDGKRKISRAEYDDGSAIVWGKPVSLRGRDLELRCRYLTRYNLILAPLHSPISNGEFRPQLANTMNAILDGSASLQDLVEQVLQLPKRVTN